MPRRSAIARAAAVRAVLNARYPTVHTPLRHRSPFELLVATILSAQCTDAQVNRVTPGLFRRFRTPQDFAQAPRSEIEALIRPTGFFRSKARHIQACAEALLRDHGGRVPRSREALTALPGVGRKTANVVLGAAFGTPGIVVDTHVRRLAGRLGLSAHRDPPKIERDLMPLVPEAEWSDFSLRLIFFGREICTARKPKCPECPLRESCPYPRKTRAAASA